MIKRHTLIGVAISLFLMAAQFATAEEVGRAGIMVKSSQLIPALSQATLDIDLGGMTQQEFLAGFSTQVWYLTSTHWLWPGPYTEGGAMLRWGLGTGLDQVLRLGLGTAVGGSMVGISVPLILEVSGRYRFLEPWVFAPCLQILRYGNGSIAELSIDNQIGLFGSPFSLHAGGLAYMASNDTDSTRFNWSWLAGFSYSW